MPRSKRPGLTVSGKAAELIYGLSRKSGVSPERILENVVKAGVVAVKEMYETLAQAEASFDELLNEKPQELGQGIDPLSGLPSNRLTDPLEVTVSALVRKDLMTPQEAYDAIMANGNDPALPGDTPYDAGATDELAHSTPQEQHSD
jgi:hypothetical protein